jgi:hypothetical protein
MKMYQQKVEDSPINLEVMGGMNGLMIGMVNGLMI